MNPLRNPLTWALAFALIAISLAFTRNIWRSPGRLTNIELGIRGLHAELNGHGTEEKIGEIVFDTRRIVNEQGKTLDWQVETLDRHLVTNMGGAHGRCDECPLEILAEGL